MGFRHPHIPALFRHLLATLALGRRHCRTRQYARRDRQCRQHQRQSGNTDFDRKSHTHKSSPDNRQRQPIKKSFKWSA